MDFLPKTGRQIGGLGGGMQAAQNAKAFSRVSGRLPAQAQF
jgi:hypothetical protein